MSQDQWHNRKTLQAMLGISRSAFFRRVQKGTIETAEVGGSKVYRARVSSSPGPDDQSHAVPGSRDSSGPIGTGVAPESGLVPAAQVLALVERYETRIDALLSEARAERANHTADRTQLDAQRAHLAGQVEQLRTAAAAAERAQLDAQHARQVEQLRAEQAIAQATQRAAELERRLEALETPWWRWRRRRALLSAVTLIEGGER